MRRLRSRLLIGLFVAVALAWGTSPDLRAAAKTAAKATAKAATKAAAKAATKVTGTMGGTAQKAGNPGQTVKQKKQLAADRKAAANKRAAQGFIVPSIGAMASGVMALPGSQPDYYGVPNWANSPWPVLNGVPATVGNPLVDRAFASDYPVAAGTLAPVLVVLPTALPVGTLTGFTTWNQAGPGGSPFASAGNVFHAYVLRPTAVANDYTVVFDSGQLTVPALTTPGVSEAATFAVPGVAIQAGDRIAFYGQGIPVDSGAGTDTLCYPSPAPPVAASTITVGGASFPVYPDARTYSFAATVLDFTTPVISGGIQKFVDPLPGLCDPDQTNRRLAPPCPTGAAGAATKVVPLAVPDTTTYPGADYYEIGLVQTREKMHRDLPATLLREYVQLSTTVVPGELFALANATLNPNAIPNSNPIGGHTGVTAPHYLGPLIVATKNRPVRITFRNLLPAGAGGDLFMPVDTTYMGAGKGPDLAWGETDPVHPDCGASPKPAGCFTDNRATLHLHGGMSPWISDGTPHQWVTSKDEQTTGRYAKGLSARNVPDMWFDAIGTLLGSCQGSTACATAGATNDPGRGALTFYYTNQQSARLLFYHDHAWGITRLNVYAGEAAGYLITDNAEQTLISTTAAGPLKDVGYGIPLVIQDRTFVPDDGEPGGQLAATDPLWDVARWGGKGSLWLPHVYVPIQNPGGTQPNGFGRWFYGPWFWPPINPTYGAIANQYYDPACVPSATQWCQPATVPGTPYVSSGMEAFHDTPMVNGVAYPTVSLEPKAYRFRLLNAANDRFFNLQWYVADATGTEVALNAAEVAAALIDPAGVIPHVDKALSPKGPDWLQIGTEGGFLPAPVVIPGDQEITYVTDPGRFDVGNVDMHSLLLGSAERADVIVDFSAFAGRTLILYNDAPAAFPARDPRYDLYSGNADQRDVGGPPTTLPGYGPNTRTVMQVKILGAAATPASVNLAALQAAFSHKTDNTGIFESAQHPVIVGQAAYNSAYGTDFVASGWCDDPTRPSARCDGFARIAQQGGDLFGFNTLFAPTVKMQIPLQPKGMHDEPNSSSFDEYGRMQAMLGLEAPGATPLLQNIVLYPYPNPPTELIDGTNLPKGNEIAVQPISVGTDGSQVWKITHNGVDTHPIHFHLYDVQVLNRSPWDGQIILPPDANELGWKDTVRISPLEDTYVALRPVIPVVPFDLPNSIRLLHPALPEGADIGFNNVDPNGNPIAPILNVPINFGWEYVWHCHILSHEEMDMMRPQALVVPPNAPVAVYTLQGNNLTVTWGDNSLNETAFVVQQNVGAGWVNVETIPSTTPDTYGPALARTYRVPNAGTYGYRVVAQNTAGYGGAFPSMTAEAISNPYLSAAAPSAPTTLSAVPEAGPQVRLTFTDTATTETGFAIERCTVVAPNTSCTTFAPIAQAPALNNTGIVTFIDPGVVAGTSYRYQVAAVNAAGMSAYAGPTGVVAVPTAPPAPAAPSAATLANGPNNGARRSVIVSWTDNAPSATNLANETGFTIQLATNSAFTAGVVTTTVGANAGTGPVSAAVGNLARNTLYYVRVKANNSNGTGSSSSAWANAAPFPIRTIR